MSAAAGESLSVRLAVLPGLDQYRIYPGARTAPDAVSASAGIPGRSAVA